MEQDGVTKATGGWKLGRKATKELAEWCQDQWRRKQPVLPKLKVLRSHMCVPLFSECLPLCYNCGTPCPECSHELGHGLPSELQTAMAIQQYGDIHIQNEGDEEREEDVNSELTQNDEEMSESDATELLEQSLPRMRLRSRKRVNK